MSLLPNPPRKSVAHTKDKMRTLESDLTYRSATLRYIFCLKMKTKPR